MKVTALVPMKKFSERVSSKNIRLVNNKPLFFWIIESLSNSNYIDHIIVNTDCEEISKLAKNFPKVIVHERPDYLTGENISIQPLIEYDISKSSANYFLQTHSTNPLLTTKTINESIEKFFLSEENDSLFSVTEIKKRFYSPEGKAINHNPKKLIRTQDLDPIYEENSCIYIFSKESNKRCNNRIGSNPLMFEINELEAVDIDNPEDLIWAEYLLKKKYE